MGIVRKEFHFPSTGGGHDIYACVWLEEGRGIYRGIVQIAHGMAEHILRYEDFAVFLANHGYIVCGNDHRGHGQSEEDPAKLGCFGTEEGSWRFLILDMRHLMEIVSDKFPQLPYFLLGHSLGSFLARQFTLEFDGALTGALYLGTSGGNVLIDIAILLCQRGIKIYGPYARGVSVNKLAFKPFNTHFKPIRTNFDWISSNPEEVDKFIADKKCGFVFTFAGYRDLFQILKLVSQDAWANGMPKALPVLLLSGEQDPVGDYGEGVKKVYERLLSAGLKNVTLKLYPAGRHEMLNEINKGQVYRYILRWLNHVLAKSE